MKDAKLRIQKRWRLGSAVALLVLAGSFILAAQEKRPPQAPGGEAVYKDEKNGFSIQFPNGWTRQQDEKGFLVIFGVSAAQSRGEAFRSTLHVEKNVIALGMDDYMKFYKDGLEKNNKDKSFKMHKEEKVSVDGKEGVFLTYSIAVILGGERFSLKYLRLICNAGDIKYIVAGTTAESTFAKYEPLLRQSCLTLKVLESKKDLDKKEK